MQRIDVRGKTCPVPVIETKRFLEASNVDQLEVLVDNATSRENVTRFLESRGYCVTVEETAEVVSLRASREAGLEETAPLAEKKVVVYIDGETVGRGDRALGAVLMKSFLHTLKEINPLPRKVIFINSGVKLAVEGSEFLGALGELENLGMELVSCGTCLDFYRLKEKLRVGRVTNMFDILTSVAEATAILRP